MRKTTTLPNGRELELVDEEIFALPDGRRLKLSALEQEALLQEASLEGIRHPLPSVMARLKHYGLLDRETGAITPTGQYICDELRKRASAKSA